MKFFIGNSNEKVVVPKYFLQILICELHSDLFKPAQDGGLTEARNNNDRVIISDFNLCKLIPPNVLPMSKQKEFFVAVRFVYQLIFCSIPSTPGEPNI
eukprot:3917696-Ditylum_brightwellii.AAC.1